MIAYKAIQSHLSIHLFSLIQYGFTWATVLANSKSAVLPVPFFSSVSGTSQTSQENVRDLAKIIFPRSSGSAPWPLPGGKCLKHLEVVVWKAFWANAQATSTASFWCEETVPPQWLSSSSVPLGRDHPPFGGSLFQRLLVFVISFFWSVCRAGYHRWGFDCAYQQLHLSP